MCHNDTCNDFYKLPCNNADIIHHAVSAHKRRKTIPRSDIAINSTFPSGLPNLQHHRNGFQEYANNFAVHYNLLNPQNIILTFNT